MRERDIENYLVKRVKALGGEVRKVNWVNRRGAPDRLVMLPDKAFWVEVKAPGVVAEPHQLREHTRMREMGQVVFLVDSYEIVESICE
jgi:hypothetical protein